MESSTPLPPPKRRKLLAVMPSPPKTTADLLAQFGAVQSPGSVTKVRMAQKQQQPAGRALRQAAVGISYADADSEPTTPSASQRSDGSFMEDPMSSGTSVTPAGYISEEDDGDTIEVVTRTKPASSRVLPGRSSRKSTSYALAARPKRSNRGGVRKSTDRLRSDTKGVQPKAAAVETARNKIRQAILEHTKPKRDAFFLFHKDYFMPVLPATSYIDKLQRLSDMADEEPDIVPYRSISQPLGVKAVLKPYQLEGLSFLVYMSKNGMSSILGDEMGLGKTLQTLAVFQHMAENEKVHDSSSENRPHLVICPLSVLSSWVNECRRWVPNLSVVRFHGPKAERERLKQELRPTVTGSRKKKLSGRNNSERNGSVDIVITTYETFVSEASWLKTAFAWRYCVLDEGHKIKNDKSDISSSLQSLRAEYRLLLTGTPLQNNLHEMWALLHWLYPDVFGIETADTFKKAFDLTKGRVSTSFMDNARSLLELVMLRRMKSSPGVDLGLPPKHEVLLYVPLTPLQRFWYTRLITRADNAMLDDLFKDAKSKEIQSTQDEKQEQMAAALLEKGAAAVDAEQRPKGISGEAWAESIAIMEQSVHNEKAAEGDTKGGDWKKLMNLVMQLRKVCSHPYLVPHVSPEPYYLGDHIKTASGKFLVLEKLIDELVVRKGKKILIFSGFTRTLDFTEDLLTVKGANVQDAAFRYLRLDGSTGRSQRNHAIRMFNSTSDYKVMLISTRAGGLGINLATASDVIFLDEDWNPQITLQAEARAHRIGQNNPVTIYKLCTQGTVEEQMLRRISKKLYLSAKITESMKNIHSVAAQQGSSKKRKRASPNETVEDDAPNLDTSQLKSLLRKGAQALARPELDVTAMLDWDFDTMIEKCKDKPEDPHVGDEAAETDEQAWLNTMERVETAVFEGKQMHRQLEKKVGKHVELSRADRRVGKNTTVMIDGFAINKESLSCGDWEAVPTFAGKDPRLAEPEKIKKAPINHQEHCQLCHADGEMTVCRSCPRSYHMDCMLTHQKVRASGFAPFACQQHECSQCGSKTSEAGGLIYRCRWCPNGYCYDCLDENEAWDQINMLTDSLPEFELLGFGANAQAWYIECPDCLEHWKISKDDHQMIQGKRRDIDVTYKQMLAANT